MPAGQPTKYKESHCDIAMKILSAGGFIAKIAAELNVSIDTIYEWMKVHKQFSESIKIGRAKSLTQWIDNPPEMNDTRYIFLLKNIHGFADRQSDRTQPYSEEFNREGISQMMSAGEMSVETGIKLLELLFKETELEDADAPINVSIVVKELSDDK